MKMPINSFQKRLKSGDLMYGMWFGLANSVAAEICACTGFDWLLIDAEHSPITDRDVLSYLQAVAPYDIDPIVRPISGDGDVLKRLLDVGVQTFLVPMVGTAAQAEDIVRATQYPPSGTRGLGTSMARAARWNLVPRYIDKANDEICVIVQIETISGLENLEAITAVKGVDAVFIGPSDLGAALGYPGQPSHESVVKKVGEAIKKIKNLGKPVGVLAVDPKIADYYIECGASFVGVGSDCGILAKGAQKLAAAFKAGSGNVKGDY